MKSTPSITLKKFLWLMFAFVFVVIPASMGGAWLLLQLMLWLIAD